MNAQSEGNPKQKLSLVGIGPKLLISISPFFVLFGILNSIFYSIFQITTYYYIVAFIGSILITIGIVIFIFSERMLSSAHGSSRLITSKTYAYVRHPMYASWGLLTLPGIFCLFNSWLFFFLLIIYYILVRIFIRKEEKYLLQKFGGKYIHYKKKVNLFFPKIKRYKPEQD